jgi:hypothetical protein
MGNKIPLQKNVDDFPVDEAQLREHLAEIDRKAKFEQESLKLLMLGAADTGKSTIFQHIKLLCGPGSLSEGEGSSTVVRRTLIVHMKRLIEENEKFAKKETDFPLVDVVLKHLFVNMVGKSYNGEPNIPLGQVLKKLWQDTGIQSTFLKQTCLPMVESIQYLLEKPEQIMSPDYVPTQEDLLKGSARTTRSLKGIIFDVSGTKFKMIDTGGQRNQRDKWIRGYTEVSALLFVASLSEYDQTLFEDEEKNRMQESLELFETIVSNPAFQTKPVYLILTKRDVLENKLNFSPLHRTFPEFSGESQLESAIEFIVGEYLRRAPAGVRQRVRVFDLNTFNKDEVVKVFRRIQEDMCSILDV